MKLSEHDNRNESSQAQTSYAWLAELANAEGKHVCNPKDFADFVDTKNPEWSKRLGECASLMSAKGKTDDDSFFAFIDEAAKLQEQDYIHLSKFSGKTVGFNINIPDPIKDAEAKKQREDEALDELKRENEVRPKSIFNDADGSYGPTAAERAYLREIEKDKQHYLQD